MLNVSASWLASLAAGVNVYGVPTFAVFTGEPVIVGALFEVETVIAKVDSAVLETPSVALM